MSDAARTAIAYINLVLVQDKHRLWPSDEKALSGALSVLNNLTKPAPQ